MKNDLQRERERELVKYIVNALVELVRYTIKASQPTVEQLIEIVKDTSTITWQCIASTLDDSQLLFAKVPKKYWHQLRNHHKVYHITVVVVTECKANSSSI